MQPPIRDLSPLFLVATLSLAACAGGGEGSDDTSGGGGNGGGGGGGNLICEETNFAAETTFNLPPGGFPMLADADHCNFTGNRTDRTYTLIDMDGDDLPDLVVTADCAGGGPLGSSHWDVYKNQGDTFSQNATPFALPPGGFPMTSDADHCSFTGNRTDRTYSLVDIDGDALPDLVVTADCVNGGSVGSSHWDVYKNDGSGFASSATRYPIPAGGFPMASDADHCNFRGNRTDRTYSLTDIDGDELPDLVVTADCINGGGVGSSHWDVYKNDGSGFAESATRYPLPSGGFPMASDADHCNFTGNRSDRTYSLTDIDGDELPDLVLTADCVNGGGVGASHWDVYKNDGSGFASTATRFAIPDGGFPMTSDADHCRFTGNRTDRTYNLTDINGDDLPDLIVTADCAGDGNIGISRWDVYENLETSFASEPIALGLPSGGFPMAADADHCRFTGNRTDRTYALTDLNGDDLPDLVVTGDCLTAGNVGTSHWTVHALECSE